MKLILRTPPYIEHLRWLLLVTPPIRTNNSEYHVWDAVEKDCEKPGGNSFSGYCTCAAGLLRCCNHVIFLLFRVAAAVRIGATKPSSTSLLAKRNVPVEVKSKRFQKPINEETGKAVHPKIKSILQRKNINL